MERDTADLVLRLQAQGLRTEVPTEGRVGGAGPSDVSMVWVDDYAITLDTNPGRTASSPFELRGDADGALAIYEDGRRVAPARTQPRPRFYDLETADGIPYWKIALLHLDSLASTVLQTCAYWGNDDQCAFCGIGVSLAGRSHDGEEDPGPAGRGGGGGPRPRRRGRRHAHDRQHPRPRPRRAVRRRVRRGGEGGERPAGRDAVRTARGSRRDRPGGRPRRRHRRHPRRVVRPGRAGAGRSGQGPHRHRRATSGPGSGRCRASARGRSPRT